MKYCIFYNENRWNNENSPKLGNFSKQQKIIAKINIFHVQMLLVEIFFNVIRNLKQKHSQKKSKKMPKRNFAKNYKISQKIDIFAEKRKFH